MLSVWDSSEQGRGLVVSGILGALKGFVGLLASEDTHLRGNTLHGPAETGETIDEHP